MEVTRTNFQEVLTELDSVLKDAAFLGIDGEFTGLNSGPDAGAFDTPAQYYAKLRAGSMDFLLVQFGLSVFTYNNETHKYNQRSYNFYVFPRPLNRAAPDCRFMCQASCISFLAIQGFDFNKLFKHGIPYLTTTEEEKLVKRLEEKQKAREEVPELITISDDDRPQIEEICTRIDEFIRSDVEELTIDKCNAFIRRLVHQEVRIRWPNKLRVETKSDCSGYSLVVQRTGTKEEEEQKDIERREKEKEEIKQAVGMSIVLRKIADSGKLIVGHNMLLDICHIIHKFFGPLPESYLEFKSLVHGLFPRLLDTKVICQSQRFKESVPSSNLNVLLETVSKSPFNIPDVESVDGRSYSTLVEKSHEAGYDAYITGLCFIALSNYLGSLQKPEISMVLSDSPLLNPFLNKLLIARLKDFPYINLVGKDPNPSRDHVFHITFPKDWKHSDLSQLFSPFGGVYVSWLSDTSAYVSLNRRDQASAIVKSLGKASTYRIQRYVEHQASLEANVPDVRKRKLSSSENETTKKEGNSHSTNGVKTTTQDDEGWETATGNELKLSSEPIIPFAYSHARSDATTKDRVNNDEAVESFLEHIKVTQKLKLTNTLSLPSDFRNGRKKDVVPKYTILRRGTEIDLKNVVEVADLLKPTQTQNVCIKKDLDIENGIALRPESPFKPKLTETKKQDFIKSIKSNAINTERLIKTNACNSSKYKQVESINKTLPSPRRSAATPTVTSSPSASPRSKRNSKKHVKTKLTDTLSEKQESISSRTSFICDNDKSLLNGERFRSSLDKESMKVTLRKKTICNTEDNGDLERPSLKLLKSGKKKSDNILLLRNLTRKFAQVAGVLLLLYIIFVF